MSNFNSRWLTYDPIPTKKTETTKPRAENKPELKEVSQLSRKVDDRTDESLEPATLLSPDIVPRLPWKLERLVSAAACNQLPQGTIKLPSGLVPDLNRYTLGWAAAYLTGDRQEALSRLWQVRRVWQGENAS